MTNNMTNNIQNYIYTFNVANAKKIHVDPIQNETLIKKIASANKDVKTSLAWDLAIINSHLVPYAIYKYFVNMYDKDYMMSDGIQGLFEACKRVKKNANNKNFVSYAIIYIFRFIMNGVRERSGQVYYPDNFRKFTRVNEISLDDLCDQNLNTNQEKKKYNHIKNLAEIEKTNEIISCFDNMEEINQDSDGEFCKEFLKLSIKHHKINRKKCSRQGITFYSKKSMRILKTLGKLDMSEVHGALGIHKQVVNQTEQAAFTYMIQCLRDIPYSYQNDFFNVIFNGKYNLKNPPPFEGWRKRIWEEVMNLEKNTFTPASYHLNLWKRKNKKEKIKKKK